MNTRTSSNRTCDLKEVEKTVHRMLSECISHGFFSINIRGEKNRGKIDVYVEGGQSVKHSIPIDNVANQSDSRSGSVYDNDTN